MTRHVIASWLCRHRQACRCAVFALMLVHPLIHGTPLDSGSLDAVLLQLQLGAMHE